MIAILKGGHVSEASVSEITAKAFQKALEDLNYKYRMLDYGPHLAEDLRNLRPSKVLIAMHGLYGEDGVVQGLLDHLEIPYTGSGVLASSLSFHKIKSVEFAKALGVPVLEHVALKKGDVLGARELEQIQVWKQGFVVKPVFSGSSRGVSLCSNVEEVQSALTEAYKWSSLAMVEERVVGRELTVSLFQGRALPPIEIVPKQGFYDMENKYTPGATEYVLPAPLSKQVTESIKHHAVTIYRAFGLHTYGRVDFLSDQNGEDIRLLEVNTLPGCTPTSLLPKSLKQEGVSFTQLIEALLQEAAWGNVR